jgi:hypothetical protein
VEGERDADNRVESIEYRYGIKKGFRNEAFFNGYLKSLNAKSLFFNSI